MHYCMPARLTIFQFFTTLHTKYMPARFWTFFPPYMHYCMPARLTMYFSIFSTLLTLLFVKISCEKIVTKPFFPFFHCKSHKWLSEFICTINLFVTSKNETTNYTIHHFKVLHKGQRPEFFKPLFNGALFFSLLL